jgi:hypothetical protein
MSLTGHTGFPQENLYILDSLTLQRASGPLAATIRQW